MKRLVLLVVVVGGVYLPTSKAFGEIIYVPAQYSTIQAGIYAASSGDTVQVAPGTYYEHIIMRSGVVIQGAGAGDDPSIHSIIDGGGTGTVVTANSVNSAAKLDGFKITNGSGAVGGGMSNSYSSPTVTSCTFSENSAVYGGGMGNSSSSSPTVSNCTFSGNTANTHGGGMYNVDSSPTVTDCTFSGNSAGARGGGMHNHNGGSQPTVTNCTFSGNSAVYGGGMGNYESSPTVTNCTFSTNLADSGGGMGNYNSSPMVTNCILWGDTPGEISNTSLSPVVTYSDIQGGYSGTGNINADPLFVDQANGDLHLQQGSPCIDAGDNSAPALTTTTADFDGDNRKIDDPKVADTGYGIPPIVDMGADEYVPKEEDFPWEMFLPAIIKKK